MRLTGRKVLIVGVGPGLGSATAYMLLKEGAEVAISARTEEKLKEVAESLSGFGKITYVTGDATTESGSKKIIVDAVEKLGRIDDLVLTVGNYTASSIADVDEEKMEFMLQTNLKAPVYLVKAAVTSLKEGSSIVMISALLGMVGNPTKEIAYASSKAAVAKATEILANDLLNKGIRVNAVAPKSMKHDFEPGRDWRKARKLGDVECPPEDVANVITFLLSKESEWIDGAVIPLDGGSRFRK